MPAHNSNSDATNSTVIGTTRFILETSHPDRVISRQFLSCRNPRPANLRLAKWQYSALASIPMYRRRSRLAATAVVPDPRKGSSTTSPTSVNSLINHSGNATGKGALCCQLLHFGGKMQDVGRIYALPPHPIRQRYAEVAASIRVATNVVLIGYAYRFLRENFGEIQAHQAFVVSMMPGQSSPHIPPTLDVVGSDAAVCYREMPVGTLKWIVLEDTDSPSGDFEEIPLNSPLAKELIGKRVGDTAVIAKGTIQDRKATIVQILPKYVRRYQDSMGEMQVRFGTASSIESVRFGGPEDPGGQKGLDSVLASVKRRADAVIEIRAMYSSQPLSLHLYGASFGGNACTAIVDLAQEQDEKVKCCLGTPEERNQALRSLQTAKALVVDITALATLRMLGLTKVLSLTKYKFIVSQRTRITLREMLSEARMFSAPGGTLSFERGRHLMYEVTAEDRERSNREDEEFIRFIEKAIELRSGLSLAALEPSKREVLEKVFGQYGAESVVLASDPDYVLWTDDRIQAQLSAHEFGVRSVWTQLVLGTLADAGLVTSIEYGEASARLIGMEYVATSFDASTLLCGFRLARWSPDLRPAAQFVKVFSDPLADLQQLFGIFVNFIERLYREPISPAGRCAITRSLLDALGGRPQAMASLESLRQLSTRVFGINAIGQKQFAECFDLWLKHRDVPLIVPG